MTTFTLTPSAKTKPLRADAMFSSALLPLVRSLDASGVLGTLDDDERTAADIAVDRGLDPRATALVLDIAVALGIASSTGGHYKRAQLMDDGWPFRALDTFLKTGASLVPIADVSQRGALYAPVVDALASRFAPSALVLASALRPARKIIDIGAGSGVWSFAMAKRSADTHVTALDFDQVLAKFTANAAACGMSERVACISGSYFDVEPQPRFDRVVLANVIHLEAQERAQQLIERGAAFAEPGGEVVIVDCLSTGSPAEGYGASVYALHLGMRVQNGRVYTADEASELCRAAGLEDIRFVELSEEMPAFRALVARKKGGTP